MKQPLSLLPAPARATEYRVAAMQFGKYIRMAADLQAVTNDLGGIYGLDADIDLAGIDWTPIGNNNAKFTGTFYGFGHSVSNLVCTNSPNSNYKGLFGCTEGSVLGGTIGSFVGYLRGNGMIEDCGVYAYGAGPRPFCGSDGTFEGESLTASQIKSLSANWPKVKRHVDGATPISTAEELLAVTNDLSGVYVLANDIDFGGATIPPIGQTTAFSGEFYGRNREIRNFVIDD